MDHFALDLLQRLAPKMITNIPTAEEMAKQNEAVRDKLHTQGEINNTPIVDNGVKVGVNIINEAIASHLTAVNP